ncbi:hypothetical protein FB451DRAFT_1472495 [Mycena latifolia]|nr:hypothetical protein FB451DRAFT_1472495 [Mycena latifolia]
MAQHDPTYAPSPIRHALKIDADGLKSTQLFKYTQSLAKSEIHPKYLTLQLSPVSPVQRARPDFVKLGSSLDSSLSATEAIFSMFSININAGADIESSASKYAASPVNQVIKVGARQRTSSVAHGEKSSPGVVYPDPKPLIEHVLCGAEGLNLTHYAEDVGIIRRAGKYVATYKTQHSGRRQSGPTIFRRVWSLTNAVYSGAKTSGFSSSSHVAQATAPPRPQRRHYRGGNVRKNVAGDGSDSSNRAATSPSPAIIRSTINGVLVIGLIVLGGLYFCKRHVTEHISRYK